MIYYENGDLYIGVDVNYPCFYPFDITMTLPAEDLYRKAALTGEAVTGTIHDQQGERMVCVTPVGGLSGETLSLIHIFLLSSSTKGSSIYYTIDGSTPVVEWVGKELKFGENTKPYNAGEGIIMPLDEEGYFTVHAIAVAEDYKNSQEAIFIYAYPDAVQSPYANIPSGSVDLGTRCV